MSKQTDREELGRIVRETWIAWAKEQPDIAEHPHWLTSWEELAERDKEVDRRIGEAIEQAVIARFPQSTGTVAYLPTEFSEWLANHQEEEE